MSSAWGFDWLNSWGNSWGTVATVESGGGGRASKKKHEQELKKHSSIFEIQEKANREFVKLYDKTPEALQGKEPIEISIPAPKSKPEEAIVAVALPPSTTFLLPPVLPLPDARPAPVMAAKVTPKIITNKIIIPDEMDDEEAITAILALIQEVDA